MNTVKLADALDLVAEGFASAALALREGPTTPQDAPSATQAPSFEELPFDEESALQEAFVDTPQGRSKSGGCPVHGVPWRIVPGGTAKATGKPYAAFWACDDRDCRERPSLAWVRAHPAR